MLPTEKRRKDIWGNQQGSNKNMAVEIERREKKTRQRSFSSKRSMKPSCNFLKHCWRDKSAAILRVHRPEAKNEGKEWSWERNHDAPSRPSRWSNKGLFKMQEIWVDIKKENMRAMKEAQIIEVVGGKAGERKVGIDGVKEIDRSLEAGKRRESHEVGVSYLLLIFMALESHSILEIHVKDIEAFSSAQGIVMSSWSKKGGGENLRDWKQNCVFPITVSERRMIREDSENWDSQNIDPHCPDAIELLHFLPLLIACLFSAMVDLRIMTIFFPVLLLPALLMFSPDGRRDGKPEIGISGNHPTLITEHLPSPYRGHHGTHNDYHQHSSAGNSP